GALSSTSSASFEQPSSQEHLKSPEAFTPTSLPAQRLHTGSTTKEAGVVLTKQLVDTASLLAVLLFGLLFFLVTVSVFVKLAYDSYKRKDYTQVDYLINGMYSDSGQEMEKVH
uniref:Uncharacterized protein n=1 Tax=Pundamilia nyererei TaxID=303518 RepID=A0A3B4GRK4_9CICH